MRSQLSTRQGAVCHSSTRPIATHRAPAESDACGDKNPCTSHSASRPSHSRQPDGCLHGSGGGAFRLPGASEGTRTSDVLGIRPRFRNTSDRVSEASGRPSARKHVIRRAASLQHRAETRPESRPVESLSKPLALQQRPLVAPPCQWGLTKTFGLFDTFHSVRHKIYRQCR